MSTYISTTLRCCCFFRTQVGKNIHKNLIRKFIKWIQHHHQNTSQTIRIVSIVELLVRIETDIHDSQARHEQPHSACFYLLMHGCIVSSHLSWCSFAILICLSAEAASFLVWELLISLLLQWSLVNCTLRSINFRQEINFHSVHPKWFLSRLPGRWQWRAFSIFRCWPWGMIQVANPTMMKIVGTSWYIGGGFPVSGFQENL